MAIIFDECLSIIRVGCALMSGGNCKGIKGEVSLILLSRSDEDEDSDGWAHSDSGGGGGCQAPPRNKLSFVYARQHSANTFPRTSFPPSGKKREKRTKRKAEATISKSASFVEPGMPGMRAFPDPGLMDGVRGAYFRALGLKTHLTSFEGQGALARKGL
ncbi:hypothetical protein TNCV_2859621 [Trichonephila clavipes]|nr:hypothetical protein TNCV_2859621 [Trichonephila clavipes]